MAKKTQTTKNGSGADVRALEEAAMDAWAHEKAAYERFDNALAAIETACDGLKGWVSKERAKRANESARALAVDVQQGVAEWFIRLGLADLTMLAAKVDAAARRTAQAEAATKPAEAK